MDPTHPSSVGPNSSDEDLYNHGISFDTALPIAKYRQHIVETIRKSDTVVVHGATGCGKTTQIPVYILDDCIRRGQMPYIIVTQPRRIAAVSIAQHVCQERNWSLGGPVGYQIAQDVQVTDRTRIVYCTLGVFLQQLIHTGNLERITHIILDEIHEREEEMDLALLLIKKLQQQQGRATKLIVMSATMQMEQLTTYLNHPPVIAVESGVFDVAVHYLEDFLGGESLLSFELGDPYVQPALLPIIVDLACSFDVDEAANGTKERGTVLVFAPGYKEIRSIMDKLRERDAGLSKRWEILPLHSSVGTKEQRRIFLPKAAGMRRIIVSTNIAESSITVPDVKYIVDLCMTKQMERDNGSSFCGLNLAWASKSNCDQRKGRAGRVSAGIAYRLVPEEFYQRMPSHGVPEMLRIPLYTTILKVKKLGIRESIQSILSGAIDPPNPVDIEKSVLELMEAGALTLAKSLDDIDGDLTSIGEMMSLLPLSISLSRLIILSICFRCVNEGIVMAACLSARSFLDTGFDATSNRYKMKLTWDRGHHSDLLAALAAYQSWEYQKQSNVFRSSAEEREWCDKYCISCPRITEVSSLVEELRLRVEQMDYLKLYSTGANGLRKASGWGDPADQVDLSLLLQFVIAGAFYPNYFHGKLKEQDLTGVKHDGRDANRVHLLTAVPNDPVDVVGVQTFLHKHTGYPPQRVNAKDGVIAAEFDTDDAAIEVPEAVYLALKIRDNRDIEKIIAPPALRMFQPRSIMLNLAADANLRAVEVSGPFSLVEINKFEGITREIEKRPTRIERSSVNSIVVNSAQELKMPRWLIAASVSSSQQEHKLLLDSTTLLRGQPGFSGLMLLIFSPTVYLIPHVQEPCYVGMRGGLGKTVQSARRTLMKDHNFTVYFDTTFTKEHLDCVVYLRIAMKCCFRRELMENSEWRRKKLPCHQRSARRILSWLLDQPYKFVHPLMNANAGAVREKHHNLLDMYPGFNWMTVGS